MQNLANSVQDLATLAAANRLAFCPVFASFRGSTLFVSSVCAPKYFGLAVDVLTLTTGRFPAEATCAERQSTPKLQGCWKATVK